MSDNRDNEVLKNKYFFDATEKIRFANLQEKNLRNTAVYLTHIKKIMTDLRDDIANLYELGIEKTEIEPILDKYVEYVKEVNTDEVWAEYKSLEKYEGFKEYVGA